jgi:signal transduction histidine kinase
MQRGPRVSLSIKAGLILFAVVTGALAIVYFAVVPQLEERLVNAKIEELESALPRTARQLQRVDLGDSVEANNAVDRLAAGLNVDVIIVGGLSETTLVPIADSRRVNSTDLQQDPVALAALEPPFTASDPVTRGGRENAEAAMRIRGGGEEAALLLSASLDDVLANVRLVRRSLVAAGIASLAISWLVGYMIAWSFTRRIRRLEAAAHRLAEGDFETPVVDPHPDEVGQLARAFDSMRLRLAALDRARGEFIANASHELRTPLFSLGGFLELLSDEDLDEETRRDFLAEMRGQIDRLTRLATDLLDLSRLDAGQLEVERRPVDLAEAARVVCEEFRPIAESGGRFLRVDGDESAEALADEQRVHQIGRILVENALRHTPEGTHAEIRVGERDGRAFLAVQDDGRGVPAEERERLFERFYRAPGGKASGSGLGLAIASELATRMDGEIEVRSEPGNTIFTLLLPLSAGGPEEGSSRENGSQEPEVARTRDSARA